MFEKKKFKRLACVILATLQLAGLLGCAAPGEPEMIFSTIPVATEPTEAPTEEPTEAPTGSPTNELDSDVFTLVDEIVYATQDLNIRKGPDTVYEKVGTLKKNDSIKRIAIGIYGWSKVIFEDEVCYVANFYLTTTNPYETDTANLENSEEIIEETEVLSEVLPTNPSEFDFDEYYEMVYTTDEVNIRSGPGTQYEKVGTLAKGESVICLEFDRDGWCQVLYNGTACYIATFYLTKIKPEEPTEPPTEAPTEQNSPDPAINIEDINPSLPSDDQQLLASLEAVGATVAFNSDGGYTISYSYATPRHCGGDAQEDPDGYSIVITKEWYQNAYVYAAHITFNNYERLWAGCAYGTYNSGRETTSHAANRVGAVLAINGDYAVPANGAGSYAIARNGVVCNDKNLWAEGVYNSATGKLMYVSDCGYAGKPISKAVAAGAVTDTFQFAPAVLINGKIIGDPNSSSRAQRTFIGTNGEPGDIWLCVSDGRYNDGKSAGLNPYQCGAYLKNKGCTFAVPLDGGGSTTMVFQGQVLNAARGGERAVADFLFFS